MGKTTPEKVQSMVAQPISQDWLFQNAGLMRTTGMSSTRSPPRRLATRRSATDEEPSLTARGAQI